MARGGVQRRQGDSVLAKMRKGLQGFVRGQIFSHVSSRAAVALERDDRAQMAAGRTPGGAKFRPLKYRKGSPLVRTGALLASIHGTAFRQRGGVKLTASAPGAKYQLSGVRRNGKTVVPKRRYLPARRSIPKRWRAILKSHATQWFRGAFR